MCKGRLIIDMIKALVLAYIITGLLVLLTAWITYKFNLSDKTIGLLVTGIYIFVTAIAGLIMGKRVKSKQYLWGMLTGIAYVVILCVISIIITKGFNGVSADGLSTLLLCMAGGTLGGMIS